MKARPTGALILIKQKKKSEREGEREKNTPPSIHQVCINTFHQICNNPPDLRGIRIVKNSASEISLRAFTTPMFLNTGSGLLCEDSVEIQVEIRKLINLLILHRKIRSFYVLTLLRKA